MKKLQLCSLLALLTLSFSASALELKFATYNIRNYDYDSRSKVKTDKNELERIITETDADLIGVEEIVNAIDFVNFIEKNFPNYGVQLTSCGGAGRQKLGFVYKKKVLTLKKFHQDERVTLINDCTKGLRPAAVGEFRVQKSGITFTALTLHLKAGGRQRNADKRHQQYKVLTTIIDEIKEAGQENIIVMGDLNTTDYIKRNNNYARFHNFLNINDLTSSAVDTECTAYWWGGRNDGLEYGSILDHILVSNEFSQQFKVHRSEIGSHCQKVSCKDISADSLGLSYQRVSDHCPVVTTLK